MLGDYQKQKQTDRLSRRFLTMVLKIYQRIGFACNYGSPN